MTSLFQIALTQLAWADVLTNKILVIVTAVIFFLELGLFIKFIPDFIYSFSTINTSISMSNNYSFSRSRATIALSFVLVVCLVADRFGVFSCPWIMGKIAAPSSLVLIGIMLVYLLLRLICSIVLRPRKLNSEQRFALRKTPHSYFIGLGVAFLATVIVAWLFKLDAQFVRTLLIWETGIVYFFSLLRSFKILRLSCSVMSSFLYLCGLEFLPSAVLIYSTFI